MRSELGLGHVLRGNTQKKRRQTHKTCTQAHYSPHSKQSKIAPKHGIHSGVGQGCTYMPMEDIHGRGWTWGNIIGTGDTGRRQGRCHVVTYRVGCVVGGQETDKKQGLARRDNDGHRRQAQTHRTNVKSYKGQIIKCRKGNRKRLNRTSTQAMSNSASTHAKMHVCNTRI